MNWFELKPGDVLMCGAGPFACSTILVVKVDGVAITFFDVERGTLYTNPSAGGSQASVEYHYTVIEGT